jgi:peptidylprolyl isomerase
MVAISNIFEEMLLKFGLFLTISLVIFVSACNQAPPTGTPPTEATPTIEATVVSLPIDKPFPQLAGDLNPPQTTASGLQYLIVKEGNGVRPQPGNLVEVHYVGSLTDGTKFDSSYDRGEPLQFTVGTGEVIPGWDEGVSLLREGGVAQLIIPPNLAYGSRGSGSVIPPDATLYLEVELLAVWPEQGFIAPAEVFEADYITTESGLKYYDFEIGRGDAPQPGQKVTVHYTGWFENESMFDSTRLRAQPFSFVLGQEEVIAGWEEAILSMKVGGKRQVIVPPSLAYGHKGAGGGAIPPDSTLIFEVELLAIE